MQLEATIFNLNDCFFKFSHTYQTNNFLLFLNDVE